MDNHVWLLMGKVERDDVEYLPICVYETLSDAQMAADHYYAAYILKMDCYRAFVGV